MKRNTDILSPNKSPAIAIVPTACGIETEVLLQYLSFVQIAIVPTACGIETNLLNVLNAVVESKIAIVPTACGIETL